MITRRWIVELLEDTWAGVLLDGVEYLFTFLFGGVIDSYRAAEAAVAVDPGTIDLVLSGFLTTLYIGGVLAILYSGSHLTSRIKQRITGSGFTRLQKIYYAIGTWLLLTGLESILTQEIYIWEMTQTNAEWIYTVRKIFTVDVTVGIEHIAFGWLGDPFVEVGAMFVLFLMVFASFGSEYVPFSSSKIFVGLFTSSLAAYAVLPKFGVEVLPVHVRWVFVGHVVFAWVIFGTGIAWVLGTVWRGITDFFAGESGYFDAPDQIKYFRDGTVLLLFPLAFLSTEYPVAIGVLAWFSYKLVIDQHVVKTLTGGSTTEGIPEGCEYNPETEEIDCTEQV
jgi:hypothetical protein